MEKKQKINCTVESCVYQDNKNKRCTLQSIDAAKVEEALIGEKGFEWIASDYDGEKRLKVLSASYLVLLVLILVLTRSYRVYKFSSRLIEKNKNKNVTLQNKK